MWNTQGGTHAVLVLIWLAGWPLAAAEIDAGKLPPAAEGKIEFDRDIRPILELSCWRCHGPEKPKSRFRLDNRESALKGGENGIDILPGNSAGSPLVHYVARLVKDMEMPPPGKGEPLRAEQVGLLRAWIDQGFLWGATNPPSQFAFSISPALRQITVEGDKAKFREVEGVREGLGGGLEHFSLQQQIGSDQQFSAEGRALFSDQDFQLKLELDKTDVGFVRGGFEQWRRYYDDGGGYYRPFVIPSFDLNRDLYLDIGRAWIDFGLELPRWPQIVLGYEYQFKNGAKSMLEWGNVSIKNIYPSAEDIHEHTHVVKLQLTHEFHDWQVEDSARIEFYDLRTRHENAAGYTLGPGPDSTVFTSEAASHVQGMNTLRLERQLTPWWLLSAGYLYSRLDGDAALDQMTLTSQDVPAAGRFWYTDNVVLKRESHIGSLASLFLPIEWLSASVGVQSEWTRQQGYGRVHLDEGDPNLPNSFTLYPTAMQSDLDEQKVSENLLLRFTKLPRTVLFAEARFDQQSIGQFEQDLPDAGTPPDSRAAFLRDTDFANDRRDLRAGFNTSPWRWIALSAEYQNRLSDSDYDHRLDVTIDPTNGLVIPNTGYSAFIRHRKIEDEEATAKLVVRPANWLKTTLTYRLVSTDYSTTTDPVPGGTGPEGLLAGKYDAHVYGVGVTLTPIPRLFFSGTFSYSDSRTETANKNPSVVPYKGNVYSVLASASYLLDQSTQLHTAYSFSRGAYGQDNVADGLPLGLDYSRHGLMAGVTRRFTNYLTANLRYGFYQYSEPNMGAANNYIAHGVFATLVVKWP